MVDFLAEQGVDGCTVLEIGGGVGDIQLELLRRGASHATNLELSSAYDDESMRLVSESGLGSRVTRRILDIAATPDEVEAADIVMLHRVVCCYPDYERLLTAAATHARRFLVFSHPPRNLVSRAAVAVQNLLFRLSGKSFRTFTHRPEAMMAVLERNGLEVKARPRALWWQVVALERQFQTS